MAMKIRIGNPTADGSQVIRVLTDGAKGLPKRSWGVRESDETLKTAVTRVLTNLEEERQAQLTLWQAFPAGIPKIGPEDG